MQRSTPKCVACSQPFLLRDGASRGGKQLRFPLLLNCGHAVCETCLVKRAKQEILEVCCPTCKVCTPLKDGEDSIKQFPVDIYMVGNIFSQKSQFSAAQIGLDFLKANSELSSKTKDIGKKTTKKELCIECSIRVATCRCIKCEFDMCQLCYDTIHKSSKILRKHKSIPLYEDESLTPIAAVCSLHSNRPIEYFCEDDVTAICSHCVIIGDHSNHNIITMEVKNKEAIEELDVARKTSNIVLHTLQKSDKMLSSILPATRENMMSSREEIQQQFRRLHGKLQTREMEVMEELGEIFQKEIDPLERMRFMLREEINKVESCLKDTDLAMTNRQHLAVIAQQLLARLQGIQNSPCYLQCTRPDSPPIKYNISDECIESLEKVGSMESSWYFRLAVLPLKDIPPGVDHDDQESISSSSSARNSTHASTWADVMSEESFEDLNGSITSVSETLRTQKHNPKTTYRKLQILKNQQTTVLVTHVKNPRSFMVQRTEDSNKLSRLSGRIQSHCNLLSVANDIPIDIKEDMPVLAQFTLDDEWYRAQIRSVIIADQNPAIAKVDVLYIDYGNTEVLPVARLRKIAPQFLKLPALAIHAALIDIVTTDQSGHWPLESVTHFAEMTNDKPLLMHVVQESEDGRTLLVDLCKPVGDDGADNRPVSVRDALVFLESACFVTSPVCNGLRPRPQRRYISQSQLRVGTRLQCCVSHFDTPFSFYINKGGDDAVELVTLMMNLQKIYGHNNKDLWSVFYPQLELVCVAQYEQDNQWYRAQVVGIPGRCNVDVLYVDFGNKARISYTKLRCIQPHLLVTPKQAIQCCLAGVMPINRSSWSTEAITRFNSYNSSEIIAVVKDVVDRQAHLALYTVDNVCINKQLVDEGFAISTGPASLLPEEDETTESRLSYTKRETKERKDAPPPVIPKLMDVDIVDTNKPKNMIEAIVTHIENPGHLYVQLCSATDNGLDDVTKRLQMTYQDTPVTQSTWQQDSHCVVQNPANMKWYRGRVLKQEKDLYTVMFLDYGTRVNVPSSALRVLKDVRDQNAYALRCHLCGVQPAGDPTTWSRTATEYLEDITNDKIVLIASKGELDDSSLPVDLLLETKIEGDALNPERTEYPSLTDMLMDRGVALPNRRLTRQNSGPKITVAPKAIDSPVKKEPPPESSSKLDCAESEEKSKTGCTEEELSMFNVMQLSNTTKPPEDFSQPIVPMMDSLAVVPTYVDWSFIIYVQQVMEDTHMEGRYGFFLKEHTLETIVQDNYLRQCGLHRARIPRDGNCLFRALAQGLYGDQGQQNQMRQGAVSFLDAHWADLGKASGMANKEEYLAEMRRSCQYGGEPEIQAMCQEFSVCVQLIIGGLSHPVMVRSYNTEAGTKAIIWLVYVSDGNIDSGHYDLAVERAEDVAAIDAVYQVARNIKICEMREWPMYRDNTVYDDSVLNQLMEYLNTHYKQSSPDPTANWMVGQSVVAQFSQDDNYYRGMITAISHDGIKVQYIDFGNSETVTRDRLRKDVILTEIPQQCFTCVLEGMKWNNQRNKASQTVLDYAHKLIVNQQCNVEVVERPQLAGQPLVVRLTLPDGRDLASELQEILPSSSDTSSITLSSLVDPSSHTCPSETSSSQILHECKEAQNDEKSQDEELSSDVLDVPQRTVPSPYNCLPQPTVGDMLLVAATQVNSPNKVYVTPVQQEGDQTEFVRTTNQYIEKLGEISSELNEHASTYPTLPSVKPGIMCCAKYAVDQVWYRAEVLTVKREKNTTLAGVFFIDYGNFDYMSSEGLRVLPDEMVGLPAMAMLLHVAGLCPPPDDNGWSAEALYMATSLYTTTVLLANVKSVDPQLQVELYDYSVCFNTGEFNSPIIQPLINAELACLHVVSVNGTVIEADFLEDAETLHKHQQLLNSPTREA